MTKQGFKNDCVLSYEVLYFILLFTCYYKQRFILHYELFFAIRYPNGVAV
jgi:hypothetical protein